MATDSGLDFQQLIHGYACTIDFVWILVGHLYLVDRVEKLECVSTFLYSKLLLATTSAQLLEKTSQMASETMAGI